MTVHRMTASLNGSVVVLGMDRLRRRPWPSVVHGRALHCLWTGGSLTGRSRETAFVAAKRSAGVGL